MTSLNIFDFIPSGLQADIVAGTNTTDLTSYIQTAIDTSKIGTGSSARWKSIFFPSGVYKITGTLYATGTGDPQSFTAACFEGENTRSTVFDYSSISTSIPALRYHGGSGSLSKARISNITFKGSSTSTAIECSGQCGVSIVDCRFETNLVGVVFNNDDTGSFTEFCVVENSDFSVNCVTALEYKKNLGDPSFHGSGLRNCTINTNGEAIIIGTGCLVYNAVMEVTIWSHNTVTKDLITNNGLAAKLHGYINVEKGAAGRVNFAGTGTVFLNGLVYVHNQDYSLGTLVQSSLTQSNSDGSTNILRLPYSQATPITTTSTTITLPHVEEGILVALRITGSNYDYRYVLIVAHDGYGGTGYYTILATLRQHNTAGYGSPTFSVDTSGNLVITNSNYASKGLNATYTVSQIGQRKENRS